MGQGQQTPKRMPCVGVDTSLTRVFELFGKRWTGLIVAVLTQRRAYFAEVRRAIPKISERMLSDRLSELADAGLVLREVDAGPPLRVSYGLTEAGYAIRPALYELTKWAEQYLPEEPPCSEVDADIAERVAAMTEPGAHGDCVVEDPAPTE